MLLAQRFLLQSLTLAVLSILTAGCDSAPLEGSFVRSNELGLEIWAPKGWIVRSFVDDGEPNVAVTRELRDDFPRYAVGFNAAAVNSLRKQAGDSPLTMARWMCQHAHNKGVATTPCRESTLDKYRRIEWAVRYPTEAPATEPTISSIMFLADDAGDNLVRLIFEAPESEWPQFEDTAHQMMSTIRIAAPSP